MRRSIDTYQYWAGTAGGPLGYDPQNYIPTLGQTFTVPVGSDVLNSFSFWFWPTVNGQGTMNFGAHVQEWNGSQPIGSSPLWDSGPSSISHAASPQWLEFNYNTGNLQLVAGHQYVAFLSVYPYPNVLGVASSVGFIPGSVYGGGTAVGSNGPGGWWLAYPDHELAFRAELSGGGTATPELPALLLLGCSGLAGLAMRRRRRG